MTYEDNGEIRKNQPCLGEDQGNKIYFFWNHWSIDCSSWKLSLQCSSHCLSNLNSHTFLKPSKQIFSLKEKHDAKEEEKTKKTQSKAEAKDLSKNRWTWASTVLAPRWGVTMTFSCATSLSPSAGGSTVKTSNAAWCSHKWKKMSITWIHKEIHFFYEKKP